MKETLSYVWNRIKEFHLNRFEVYVLLLVAFYGVFFSYVTILRHYAFITSAWDLGIYNQAFSTTLRNGKLFYETAELWGNPSGSIFGGKFVPVLFLIFPFYALRPAPETLLVVQSFAIGLGAIPVFWLARDKLRSSYLGLAFAAMYLLYAPIQGVNIYDFHPQAFFSGFMLFAIYYFSKGRWVPYFVFTVLTLMTIGWSGLIVGFFGLGILFVYVLGRIIGHKNIANTGIWVSLLTAILGLSWSFLSQLVIATVNPNIPEGFIADSPWGVLGFNPLSLRFDLLFTSARGYEALMYEWDVKSVYLLQIFGPLAFSSLIGVEAIIPCIPWFFLALLSNYGPYYQLGWQYPALVAPFIFAAAILGVRRFAFRSVSFRSKRYSLHPFIVAPILCSLLFSSLSSPLSPLAFGTYHNAGFPTVSSHDKLLRDIIRSIPENASILTQYNIFPHFSNRLNAYVLPPLLPAFTPSHYRETVEKTFAYSAEYVLIDLMPKNNDDWNPDLQMAVRQVLSRLSNNSDYGLYLSVDGIILFKRGYIGDPTRFSPLVLARRYSSLSDPEGYLISHTQTIFDFPLPQGIYTITAQLLVKGSDSSGSLFLGVYEEETVLSSARINLITGSSSGTYQNVTANFEVNQPKEDANIRIILDCNSDALRVYLDYREITQKAI